jgi:hypothetical protein
MFLDNTRVQRESIKSPILAAYYRYVRRQRVLKLVKPEFWVFGMAICSARYVLVS